ncbi:hypothetical protein B0A48_05436 [Cryoendolithus antarcticus]|uniref:Uncharacterized protein n=1 Tax=Cryoendolithus antarcticus TaxID=1507870 RepID=A0A1V8TIJ1_9PEZI|nr:hypothetical protein B0A48_05436 [Cryoendolithus antarcticus]
MDLTAHPPLHARSIVPWKQQINFASALLLHSCITVLAKELLNLITIVWRLANRYLRHDEDSIASSVVLDAYTSILSKDADGEQSELYFTNTGVLLLASTLAASVSMNLLLSSLILNLLVASTFVTCFFASLASCHKTPMLPILALRRAGRFIWSDTPFVNFFSVIYIATVLHGQATLRLQDYITFRAIAVLELVFMKAQLASAQPDEQITLLTRLLASEWVIVASNVRSSRALSQPYAKANRESILAFTTAQRLSVMLVKSTPGYHRGCLRGPAGPAILPLPAIGSHIEKISSGWCVYRPGTDVLVVEDALVREQAKNMWMRFLQYTHGCLLRKLDKVRVVYLLRTSEGNEWHGGKQTTRTWRANINLVTGISGKELRRKCPGTQLDETCVVE